MLSEQAIWGASSSFHGLAGVGNRWVKLLHVGRCLAGHQAAVGLLRQAVGAGTLAHKMVNLRGCSHLGHAACVWLHMQREHMHAAVLVGSQFQQHLGIGQTGGMQESAERHTAAVHSRGGVHECTA